MSFEREKNQTAMGRLRPTGLRAQGWEPLGAVGQNRRQGLAGQEARGPFLPAFAGLCAGSSDRGGDLAIRGLPAVS
jgi:hypothetical protein